MRYESGYDDGGAKRLSYYRHCQWCGGRGCLQCEVEADKDYKRQFPNGLQPIATFKLPEQLDDAKRVIGREAIEHAFGPEGRGVQEIIDNARNAT